MMYAVRRSAECGRQSPLDGAYILGALAALLIVIATLGALGFEVSLRMPYPIARR